MAANDDLSNFTEKDLPAEIAYRIEQENLLTDFVYGISTDPRLPVSLAVTENIPLDGNYYQSITTDGTYLYLADHNDGDSPNLKMTKIGFDGSLILSTTVSSDALLVPFSDWNISDWFYHSDGFIYAVFGKTTVVRATKVIKIDPSDFSLDSVVYTSTDNGDENVGFYGEGIVYHDSKWWITYEAYTTGGYDYMDTFDDDWMFVERYQFQGINLTNFPRLGTNHVQGIDFHDGFIWFTIHPQESGFAYRGALVAGKIIGTNVEIAQIYDLSDELDDAIGEGIQWYNGKIYLNGIDFQCAVLQDSAFANATINSGTVFGTNLNQEIEEVFGNQPHIFLPQYGSHHVEVTDDATMDVGTKDFSIIAVIEPTETQSNLAGIMSKSHSSGNKKWALALTSANKPYLIVNDGTDEFTARCEYALPNNKKAIVAVVVDRSGTEPYWYVNGVQYRSDDTQGTLTDVGDLDNDGSLYLGRLGGVYMVGKYHKAVLFQRTLEMDEVRKYGLGSVATAVGRFSDTSLFADTDFSTANWTRANVTSSGSLTFTTNAAGGAYPAVTTIVIGKRYRMVAAYTHNASAIEVRPGATETAVLMSSATGGTVDFWALDTNGPYFRLSGAGTITFTTLTIKELVDPLAFLPQNLTYKQWSDTSYPKLIGEFRGGIINELPQSFPNSGPYNYRRTFITLDTTFTNCLPPGAVIDYIVIRNRTANAVTGGIDIGTSAGGGEVVNAQAVGASAYVYCTVAQNIFSFTAYQTLYVTAVTNWNSSSLDIFIGYRTLQ